MEGVDSQYLSLGLAPGALSQDLVEVEGHGLVGDQALDFGLEAGGEDSHEGLGGKSVLGALLVVSLRKILEESVGGLVNVVDDLAKISLEVTGGKGFKVSKSFSGNVSLPLEFALALINDGSELGVLIHVSNEGLGKLQLVSGGGDLSTGEGEVLLVLIGGSVLAEDGSLTEVCSEADEIEVLVDVVHDLGLKEGLGSVIHDLVAELGFSNVFSQLLDTSSTGLDGSIFVNNFVTFSLGGLTIGKLSNELFDDFEFSSEEGILGHVHLVSVHLEEIKVDSRNSLNKAFIRGSKLEFSEEAGGNTSSGGSGETNLAVNNDGAVDSGSLEGLADIVEVSLSGSSRVADGDSHVDKSGELLLKTLNDLGKGGKLLDFNFTLLLVDINVLELVIISLGTSLNNSEELLFVLLNTIASDVTELSVLTNLVGRAGTDGIAIHIHNRLLAHVEPDNLVGLGIEITTGLIDGILKSSHGRLAAAVDLVSRNSTEVGNSINLLWEFLNFIKVIGHGGSLPYFWIFSHDCGLE